MKKILLFGLINFFVVKVNAQTVVFSENFATQQSQQPGWTVIDADGDTKEWGFYDFGTNPLASNHPSASAINPQGRLAISQSYDGTALTPNNFLISPAISLSNTSTASGSVTLKFKVGSDQSAYIYAQEKVSVYVVTDISNPTTISSATPIHSAVLASTGINEFTYDISSKAGQTVYLVFRHHGCTDMGSLLLDDILVTKASGGGLNETDLNLSVYPNPTNDYLNFSFDQNIESIYFYNEKGMLVLKVEEINSKSTIVDINDFNKGVYFYDVISSSGKVIKNTFVKN